MTTTPNLKLELIAADLRNWSAKANSNYQLIDATVGAYFALNNLQGVWENSRVYQVGETVIDADSTTVWQCQAAHTSAMLPTTFSADRTAHNTYWTVYSSPARARGAWTGPGTNYTVNDFIVSGSQYAVCIVSHVSGATFSSDVAGGKWSILVDLSLVGSQVLPVPGGAPDADKFVVVTPEGSGYSIVSGSDARSKLGFTSIGTNLVTATSSTAAREAINAQIAGSYAASNFGMGAPNAMSSLTRGDIPILVSDGTWKNFSNFIDLRATGATCSGSVDESSYLNNLITDLYNAGGGTIVIPKNVGIASTIVAKSQVNLIFMGGAKLVWLGSTSGTCFATDVNDVVENIIWCGLTIDTGAAFTGTAAYIHSAHNIHADVIRLITTGTTSIAMKMYADSIGGETALTKRNLALCHINSLIQHGQCGRFLETGGVAVGYDGSAQVVTLCTIASSFAENCAEYGYNLRHWTDNNAFSGMHRVALNANNAVGLQVGDASGSGNQGVYQNKFDMLAVDTFGTLTGRVGIALNRSKLTLISAYYQHPEAEGGRLTATTTTESYDIRYYDDTTKLLIHYMRKSGYVLGGVSYNSSPTVLLANDTATSFDVDDASVGDENIILLISVCSQDANSSGIAWCRVRKSFGAAATTLLCGGPNFDVLVSGGVLSGTTGTITKLTVSAGADGKVYVENRIGAATQIVVTYLGRNQTA